MSFSLKSQLIRNKNLKRWQKNRVVDGCQQNNLEKSINEFDRFSILFFFCAFFLAYSFIACLFDEGELIEIIILLGASKTDLFTQKQQKKRKKKEAIVKMKAFSAIFSLFLYLYNIFFLSSLQMKKKIGIHVEAPGLFCKHWPTFIFFFFLTLPLYTFLAFLW